MTTKKQNEHYVNNKDFTNAVAEYVSQIKEATDKGKTPPRMSEYIDSSVSKGLEHRSLANSRRVAGPQSAFEK